MQKIPPWTKGGPCGPPLAISKTVTREQTARPVPLRLLRDAGRGLLRRPGVGKCSCIRRRCCCDTMNWQPLTREHGAPLRLYLAVKYGYKSLKRVGLIRFTDERPRDYWADRGYDWYAG